MVLIPFNSQENGAHRSRFAQSHSELVTPLEYKPSPVVPREVVIRKLIIRGNKEIDAKKHPYSRKRPLGKGCPCPVRKRSSCLV